MPRAVLRLECESHRHDDGAESSLTRASRPPTPTGCLLLTMLLQRVRACVLSIGCAAWLAMGCAEVLPPPSPISIAPGENWQAKVSANPDGTVFRILVGRHIHVAVIPKSGNQFIGDPGAIMDGQNSMDFAFSGGAANVVLDNLEITGYLGGSAHIGAIQGYDATGWVLNNLNVHDNAYLGANLRGSFTVLGGSYHHNGQYGLAVTQAINSVIDGAELSYNNLARVADPLLDAGGIKVSNSNGMTIRNVNSHHNNGPGIWYDINNQGSVVENNTVHDNNYAGIFYEISYNGIIRGNTVSHNGTSDSNYTGAGILVSASPDVQVISNTVVASTSHGIIALQETRGSGILGLYQTRNLSVHDNTVTLPSGKRSGMLDFISSSDRSAMLSDRNNIFNNNNYTIDGNTLPFYPGNLNAVSQAGWQALGQDVGSTFGGP